MVLNLIDEAYIGGNPVDEIYLGSTLIWPSEVPPTPPEPEPVYPYEAVYSPHDEIWYYRESRIPTTFGDDTYVIEHTYSYNESLGYGKGVVKFGYDRDYPVIPHDIFKHDDYITAIYYPEDVEVTGGDWIDSLPKLKRINCNTDGVAIFGGATRYLNPIIPPIDYNVGNFKTIILGKNVKSLNRYSLSLNCDYYNHPDIYCYSTIQPTIVRSPILMADVTGTLHYPKGSDYSGLITELGSGWTGIADL